MFGSRRARILTAVVFVAATLALPAPAQAAASGTAMVQTQRMAGPTLNTTQNGWYAQGQVLSLVCHQRGQAVKGYYSPYIPGEWDDLWYKVSDGYWVADVDINTGSNDPVAPACAPPPVTPSTASGKAMVQTQRMSGPSLGTTQNGWYARGQVLGLVCHQRGQAVKGYFSPYLAGGGWDNLWYQVSDGYWVADVDIDTGTNDVVVGACPGAPVAPTPTPASSSGFDRAAARDYALANANEGKDHLNRFQSDCTWFASNVLWAGGMKKTGDWSGFKDVKAIRANALVRFLVDTGRATQTDLKWRNDLAAKAQVGDLIAYDWERGPFNRFAGANNEIDHIAVVTSFTNGYPNVTQHTTNRAKRFWSWDPGAKNWIEKSKPGSKVYLIHIKDGS